MYRILIADDDCMMRKALKVMIDKVEGFEVCGEADNGRNAVSLHRELHPDIIFMDNRMPVMTGLEAVQSIRNSDDKVTIYILSAYTNFNLVQEAMRLKVKDYLLKPIPLQALIDLLVDYKTERDGNVSTSMQFMEEIIETRDFAKAYYGYGDKVLEIYNKYLNNTQQLIEAFRYIGQRMIATIGGMDGHMRNVGELFPINNSLIVDPYLGKMWIFNLIDYVFKQRSLKRYPVLGNVFQYIDEHISEEIGLTQIIENCAISQGYLSRIFKDQFGVSVMEYLHMRKIHMAKNYMYLTNDSVAEIAYKLGYSESSYFSKVFKKYENMTVQQYRKTILSTKEMEVR